VVGLEENWSLTLMGCLWDHGHWIREITRFFGFGVCTKQLKNVE